jgi:hypothetical protein
VLIDCPPSLGILTMNALCASTDVLLPIQAEFFALQGVAGILESLKAVQRLNRNLRLSFVVPCLVDKRKTLAREILDEVRRYFGNLVTNTMIRANVKLAEAPSHGKTIFEYDAASNGARDYEALAAEILGEPQLPPEDEDDVSAGRSAARSDESAAVQESETAAEPETEQVAEAPAADPAPEASGDGDSTESPTDVVPPTTSETPLAEDSGPIEDVSIADEVIGGVEVEVVDEIAVSPQESPDSAPVSSDTAQDPELGTHDAQAHELQIGRSESVGPAAVSASTADAAARDETPVDAASS